MRICLMIEGQEGVTWKRWKALAAACEEHGYEALFRSDHYLSVMGRGDRGSLDAWATLAALAAVTSRVRLGTLVSPATFRHPSVLAKSAVTVDQVSGGRAELGIGAGWLEAEHLAYGFPFADLRTRMDVMAEQMEVVACSFADEPFSFKGEHYTVTDLDGMPKPVQKPYPPFIVGGGGPKILGVAAREASIVGINAFLRAGEPTASESVHSLTPAATDQKLEWLRAAAGEGFDELELQTLVGFVLSTDDRASIGQGMAAAFGVEPDDALEAPVTLVGAQDQMIDALEARRARWQISYVVIPSESMDMFAPVVARLAGK
jgi:probable F420-dependent oxidoreductase